MVKSQRAAYRVAERQAPKFCFPLLRYSTHRFSRHNSNIEIVSFSPSSRKREVSHKRNGNSILRLGGGGEGERERVRRPIYNGGRFPIVGVSNSPVHLTIPPDSHAIPERRRRRRDRGRRRSVPPLCLTTERNRENAAVTLSRSDTANSPLDPCRSINLSPCPGQSEKWIVKRGRPRPTIIAFASN